MALTSIKPHIVCAIALRYSDKPEVYPIAMHFAKSAASSALIDGWKSVELCQAYILMSIYVFPRAAGKKIVAGCTLALLFGARAFLKGLYI